MTAVLTVLKANPGPLNCVTSYCNCSNTVYYFSLTLLLKFSLLIPYNSFAEK
jgi:hypothetical protein